jgi:lipoprotein NlpI
LLRDSVDLDEWSAFTDKIVKLRPKFSAAVTVSPLTKEQIAKLKSDVDALEMSIRKGKNHLATAVQFGAEVKRIVLTAELEGGRLNPSLKAQALSNRGVQLDQLGRYDEAAKDFEDALALSPDDADTRSAAATNAFLRGQDKFAIAQAEKAMKLAPSDQSSLNIRALSRYYTGDYAHAKDDLLKLLKRRSEVDRGYAALWLYLTARRMGEDGNAAVKAYLPASSRAQWPSQIMQTLIGKSDYNSAFKAAAENTKDASQLCELYFYAGEKASIDGDRKRARELFQKAVDTGIYEYNEYSMAKRSLKRMDEEGAS